MTRMLSDVRRAVRQGHGDTRFKPNANPFKSKRNRVARSDDALLVHETERRGTSEGSSVEPRSGQGEGPAVGSTRDAGLGGRIGRPRGRVLGSCGTRLPRTLDLEGGKRCGGLNVHGERGSRPRRASAEGAGRDACASRLAAGPEPTNGSGGYLWRIVTDLISSLSFPALGSTATVVTAEEGSLLLASEEVRRELADIDRTCSRFRDDSDLMNVNAGAGSWVNVAPLLVEAMEVALGAARVTGGLVDPTIGGPMLSIGYDRDFAEVLRGDERSPSWIAVPGWELVETRRDPGAIRIPAGVHVDLGSTGKALAADRSALRAASATGAGVLVGLGGDIAAAGPPPADGWAVGIAEDHTGEPEPGETIAIFSGGVATSSTTVRRWTQAGTSVHHILDPRTGRPTDGVWRTVSVCAATCVDANIASTAAIVAGEGDPGWLARQGLPARLVRRDGTVVRLGGWPEAGP
jgi:FAD:protein FMN transferase